MYFLSLLPPYLRCRPIWEFVCRWENRWELSRIASLRAVFEKGAYFDLKNWTVSSQRMNRCLEIDFREWLWHPPRRNPCSTASIFCQKRLVRVRATVEDDKCNFLHWAQSWDDCYDLWILFESWTRSLHYSCHYSTATISKFAWSVSLSQPPRVHLQHQKPLRGPTAQPFRNLFSTTMPVCRDRACDFHYHLQMLLLGFVYFSTITANMARVLVANLSAALEATLARG